MFPVMRIVNGGIDRNSGAMGLKPHLIYGKDRRCKMRYYGTWKGIRDFGITVILLVSLVGVSVMWGFDICNRRWEDIAVEKDVIIQNYKKEMERGTVEVEYLIGVLYSFLSAFDSYAPLPEGE